MRSTLPIVALWSAVALLVLALGLGALEMVSIIERGPEPRFVSDPTPAPPFDPELDPSALHLAGSGSNLALTRKLAQAFGATRPDSVVIVHESIGSSGGVAAVGDAVIDIGLVSRDLRPDEGQGLTFVPYAKGAVVFAAHLTVPEEDLDREAVLALWAGERRTWPSGKPVVVLLRERGDSSSSVAGKAIEGFSEADDAAREGGRFRVLYHDYAMQEVLVTTPGAIGLFDGGTIAIEELPLRQMRFEGVDPSLENVQSGRWPLSRRLAFVLNGQPSPLAAEFLDFVFSGEGAALIERSGYLALPRREYDHEGAP